MKDIPVPLLLDLWATGLSASNIAAKLGVHPRSVSLVVEQARDIGDTRAVHHVGKNGRPLGRPTTIVAEMVPAVVKLQCIHGHERALGDRNCRTCQRLRDPSPRRRDAGRSWR